MCAQAPAAGGWTAACPQRAGDVGDLSPHFPVTSLTQKAQDCVLCAVRGSEMVPGLGSGPGGLHSVSIFTALFP